jgi:hypothetical protein
MAFSGIRNHLGPLAKIGNVLTSSVGDTLGRVGAGLPSSSWTTAGAWPSSSRASRA